MKTNVKIILKPALILFAICLIVALALAVTNLLTAAPIAAQKAAARTSALSEVLPAGKYEEIGRQYGLADETAYAATEGGQTLGYLFITSANGYGGSVEVMTAVSSEGRVLKIKVLDCSSETPGLGQKAGTQASFLQSFSGKTAGFSVDQIDALTGATITSRAVTQAVNQALSDYQTVGGGTK